MDVYQLYNESRKWLFLISSITVPILLVYDAPFGRFAPAIPNFFMLDGIKSWIAMELVSPIVFIATFLKAPLAQPGTPPPALTSPPSILAAMFLIHYANRAIISPLRTPSRSKLHTTVFASAILFNSINGFIMGAYLTSTFARIYLDPASAFARTSFYAGIFLWAAGFVGNIVHDEILLNIRRKAKETGKGKTKSGQEHYAIPHGLLYTYVSYPNYFCEWIEWLGFALASGPLPFTLPPLSVATVRSFVDAITIPSMAMTLAGLPVRIMSAMRQPANLFAPHLAPPYVFLCAEVFTMLPRAYRGHVWYHTRFGDAYPPERRAVIPFVL